MRVVPHQLYDGLAGVGEHLDAARRRLCLVHVRVGARVSDRIDGGRVYVDVVVRVGLACAVLRVAAGGAGVRERLGLRDDDRARGPLRDGRALPRRDDQHLQGRLCRVVAGGIAADVRDGVGGARCKDGSRAHGAAGAGDGRDDGPRGRVDGIGAAHVVCGGRLAVRPRGRAVRVQRGRVGAVNVHHIPDWIRLAAQLVGAPEVQHVPALDVLVIGLGPGRLDVKVAVVLAAVEQGRGQVGARHVVEGLGVLGGSGRVAARGRKRRGRVVHVDLI